MKDEKLSANTDKRLRDLLTVLDESPFINDAEIPSSYRSILMEVTENLTTIQYYCGEWHKSNKLKRMKQGSATRHKLQQVTQSIVNLTKLLETVSQMPDNTPAQTIYTEEGEDPFDVAPGANASFVRQATRSKDTQAIMETLARFEEKINEFKDQQKTKHFLDSERAEEEKMERNDSQKRKQQKVKEANKADERRSSEKDIQVNKDVESKKFEQ